MVIEVAPNNILEVTFANFVDVFKNFPDFDLDYTKIAIECKTTERTLLRWRTGKYKTMKNMHYTPLFKLLEEKFRRENERVVFLVDAFHMPRQYRNIGYDDLKGIIIRTLDDRLAETDTVSDTQQDHNMIAAQSIKKFINRCLDKRISIKSISMAFHSGWYWWDDHEMTKLLKKIDFAGIKIRVMANSASTIKQIAMAMRDSELTDFYLGFDETLAKWHEWEESKLKNLDFRICGYPLFRKIVIVEYVDGAKEALFRDYVYAYGDSTNESNMKLTERDPSMDIFQREYEFLWGKSVKYSLWYSSQPEKEEIMEPGNYLFFQLSHSAEKEDNGNDFVVSGLSIGNNNSATLYMNVMDSTRPFTRDNAEYIYSGMVRLAGNIVFMNLIDEDHQEQVNISLKAFKGKERYIGITTGLSTGYQPVAFKCACLSKTLLSKIDFQKLKEVLSQHNREWGDNLMILEERDIDLFFSNRIMKSEKERN